MVEEHNTLRAIDFDKKNLSLRILDQLVIPYSTTYIDIRSIEDAFQAIKRMQVRGAPAIAIVGSFAIVVEINFILLNHKTVTVEQLLTQIDYLVTSRPTAVNLGNSARDIKDLVLRQNKKEEKLDHEILELVLDYSLRLYEDDLINNFKIGENGLKYIKDELKRQNFEGPFSILTVCNTGSLATSGHGTALGVIRTTYSDLKRNSNEPFWLEKVYPCETRPYNQGSRLTTYELDYEKIPFTLVCDNMVVSLINSLNQLLTVKDLNAPIKFIIVGADRVVKNGDTANKIGTFQLAAIANFFNQNSDEKHKINFLVALPTTSLDMVTTSGEKIVVEERPSRELTTITGQQLKNDGTVGDKAVIGIATPGISVWNPAFDITPHSLIDSIITEDEVYTKKEGRFNF